MKITKGFLQKLVARPIWLIGSFSVLSLVLTNIPAAHAAWSLAGIAEGVFKGLLGGIFSLVGLIGSALSNLFVLIINSVILPGQNSLFFGTGTQATAVKHAFDGMLSIANLLFFITLVIFAIMIITRSAGYNFKKAITALITAIVLANISYPLMQIMIEMGDSLRNTGTVLFGGATNAGAWGDWLNSLAILDYTFDPKVHIGPFLLMSFAAMATQLILAYVFFRLMAVLVERAIRLVALTIFAPIQAVLGIFPQKDLQIGGNWISEVIKWVLVLPVVFILIGIAKQLMPENTSESLKTVLQSIATTDPNTGATTTPTIAGLLFQIILGLGIMASAANVPALLKVPVSAATKFMTDSLNGGGFIGKPLKAQAGLVGDYAKAKFAGTRAGQFMGRMSERNQAFKNKVESMKKVNQTATENATSARAATAARQTSAKLKQGQDSWIKDNYGINQNGTIWNDTEGKYVQATDAQKSAAKKAYRDTHRQEALAMDAASNIINSEQVKERKEIADVNPDHEEAKEKLNTLFERRDAEEAAGRVTEETKREIRQLVAFIQDKAKDNSPAAVPWKMMMQEDVLNNKAHSDAVYGTATTQAGLTWRPPSGGYAISPRDRAKWEEAEANRTAGTGHVTENQFNTVVQAEADYEVAVYDADLARTNSETVFNSSGTDPDAVRNLEASISQLSNSELLQDADIQDAIATLASDTSAPTAVTGYESLSPTVKSEIERIANSNASAKDKAQAIDNTLKNHGFGSQTGTDKNRQAIANIAARGGAQNWNALRNMATQIRTKNAGGTSTSAGTLVAQTAALATAQSRQRQTEIARDNARQTVNATATPSDGYTRAVNDAVTAGTVTPADIEGLYTRLTGVLQTNPTLRGNDAINSNADLAALLAQFGPMIESLGIGDIIDLGITDWTDAAQVGKLQSRQMMEVMTRLNQVIHP